MIIKSSPDEIQNYLVDASNFKGYCDAVYFPENTEDVVRILTEANQKKIQVTISGNGTGLTGGRVPEGGIVISTEKMNKIFELNTEEHTATLQPGVVLSEFLGLVKENGLLYPPDPTEKNCFVGGTIATNASGEKTFKYGPTRQYVLALDIVLPDGDRIELRRGEVIAGGNNLEIETCGKRKIQLKLPDIGMPQVKNAAGYFIKSNMDAIDLFIGSEGTLGVITKIKLKLLARPEKIISCIVFFNTEIDALSFIARAREISFASHKTNSQAAVDALALEYFDGNSLNFLHGDYSNIPADAQAAVWFEQQVTPANEDVLLDRWMELITEFNGEEDSAWFAIDETEKNKILEFRHSISAKVNEYISKNNFRKLGTDVAVPDDRFQELYNFSKKLVENSGIHFIIYGHVGNSHIHLNMLPKSDEEYLGGRSLYKEICRKAVELKGTVSAEHGIGKLKTEYLLEMYGENTVSQMIELKKVFDPNMILGAGNIFKSTIV